MASKLDLIHNLHSLTTDMNTEITKHYCNLEKTNLDTFTTFFFAHYDLRSTYKNLRKIVSKELEPDCYEVLRIVRKALKSQKYALGINPKRFAMP